MAKKTPKQSTRPVAKRGVGYAKLVKAISQVNTGMVARAAVAVNQALVLRNWLIGAYIVEFEQNGADRAKYGVRLLATLAEDLKAQGLKGLEAEMLRSCRSFFLFYPQISQPVVGEFALPGTTFPISQPLSGKLDASAGRISSGAKFRPEQEALPTALPPEQLARISWTHFLELIRIEDPWKRAFYENELLQGNWSKRQLQRLIGSLLYRLLRLPLPRRPAIGRKTPPLPRSRPRTHRKPDAAALSKQTHPAQTQDLSPRHACHPAVHPTAHRTHRVEHSPLRDRLSPQFKNQQSSIINRQSNLPPTTDDFFTLLSASQRFRISAFTQLVVGEWVASIDRTMNRTPEPHRILFTSGKHSYTNSEQ